MKRLALTAIALSMFAVPTLQSAQAAPALSPQSNLTAPLATEAAQKRGDHRRFDERRVVKKKVVTRNVVKRAPHWKRGQKYASWKRYRAVNDYGRYGLHRPAYGQHWIRVGNDFLLVSIATGLIFGAIAAR